MAYDEELVDRDSGTAGRAGGRRRTTDAEPMEMGGRSMAGWLRVPAGSARTTAQLTRWIKLATTYVATLPPKAPKPARRRSR